MTTHIRFPELDDDPATLSHAILTGILRDDLGFDGVIFTDSLSMDAIEARYGHGDAAIRCKLAGVDVLEANESIANQLTRFQALVDAAMDGTIPLEIFNRTRDRLDALRARFDIGSEPPSPAARGVDPRWDERAMAIAARTIVSVPGGRFDPIPVDDRLGVLDFQRLRPTEAEDPFNRAGIFREAALTAFPRAHIAPLPVDPTDAEIAAAIALAPDVDTLVIMTRDAALNRDQIELANRIRAHVRQGTRTVHVALRGPYDAGLLADVDATLLTFGDPAVSLRALARLLAGAAPVTGRLPIRLAANVPL